MYDIISKVIQDHIQEQIALLFWILLRGITLELKITPQEITDN